MAELEYPRNTVWYIEVRPKNEGYAPLDPVSMGSAVVVELEKVDERGEDDGDNKKRDIKKYLLTCAHVVRAKSQEAGKIGPAYGEILCFEPGKGYARTAADSRVSGHLDGVAVATVSPYSPCGGQLGSVPFSPQTDWVLLEVKGDALKNMPTTLRWAEVSEEKAGRLWLMLPSFIRRLIRFLWGQSITLLGYPGGAGFAAFQQFGAAWKNTEIVENRPSEGFRQIRTPEHGLLLLDGPDESRPGMSGGGVFDQNNDLLGIHRAATDATMGRDAVSIRGIQDDLWKHHRLRPVDYPPGPLKRPWLLITLVGLLLAGGLAYIFIPRKDPIDPVVPVEVPADVTAQFLVVKNNNMPMPGIKVRLESLETSDYWEKTSDGDGRVSFTLPGALTGGQFRLRLPSLGAAFLPEPYLYTPVVVPINTPPQS